MPLLRLYVRAGVWVRHRCGRTDRGDSPVPSAVIIVGFAIVAGILVGLVLAAVDNIWEKIPGGGDLPDLPGD